ncbi:MAG: non-canonical purine NTP pyrophosphatase [Isosphaeraceae bacterium]
MISELQCTAALDCTAHFVCVIALARDGKTIATFKGVADGKIVFDGKPADLARTNGNLEQSFYKLTAQPV